jgi:hypothetical protein
MLTQIAERLALSGIGLQAIVPRGNSHMTNPNDKPGQQGGAHTPGQQNQQPGQGGQQGGQGNPKPGQQTQQPGQGGQHGDHGNTKPGQHQQGDKK